MFSVDGVIFDLDGTLINSKHDYGEMSRRVQKVLLDIGVESSILEKPGKTWQVTRGGPGALDGLGILDSDKEMIIQKITEALNSVEILSLETINVIPNAIETLKYLHNEGYSLGIATRACKEYSEKALKKLNLDSYIDVMSARDEVDYPKPDPRHLFKVLDILSLKPENAVYIGDTVTDLNTARAANVNFIAYLGNPRWATQLKEGGIDFAITDLIELKKLVKKKGLPRS